MSILIQKILTGSENIASFQWLYWVAGRSAKDTDGGAGIMAADIRSTCLIVTQIGYACVRNACNGCRSTTSFFVQSI